MKEKTKVTIVNCITGSRILGTFALPIVTSLFGPLGAAIYIGSLWLTDAIDGFLARHWKVSTIFGANLDAFSDKLLGISILFYLRGFFPSMIIPLISEFAIFGVNWHYGRKGADVKSSKWGKRKTIIFGITATLAMLSTISFANFLSAIIPVLITITSCAEVVTLTDYVKTHKKYLKTHNPKNDVSHMGFFETIKTIIKKLGDKNLYSPEYYKEHKDEPLLDVLLNNENQESKINITEKETETNNDTKEDNSTFLTIPQQNELKIKYNLLDKDIEALDGYMKCHNITFEEIKEQIERIIANEAHQKLNKTEEVKINSEKTKTKKK